MIWFLLGIMFVLAVSFTVGKMYDTVAKEQS